ncbi:MAG TPA: LLM class flavin-dependent oxidoreductase [Gammaproteobacteria bacterium]|jgi:5,10-methylenetetrahydromethanopterin reductase|nr:LLM class flavin-dependent oxidoreductase [Gammaproteobacteria bacterium]
MKIDIILEPDLTPEEICDLGLLAENYGVDSVWTSNYFSHWDPFISLTQLANQSREIKLGILAVSPFEMHPLKIANSLLTLNEISQGRAQIAVGAGEGNLTAMNLDTPKKIVLAVREALEIINKACCNDLKKGYEGEIFSVSLPCDYGWAKQKKPIVYGTAYRHMMMRMEGRVADGVYIGATPPEVLEEAIDNIQIGKEKRLDGNEDVLINSFWAWHIKSDKEEAYKESRRELAWRARKLEKSLLQHYFSDDECEEIAAKFESFVDAYFDRSGNIKDIDIEIANKLCRVFTSTGDLSDLESEIARFKQFEKMGQTHLSLRLHDDPKAALDIIGKEVLPHFK